MDRYGLTKINELYCSGRGLLQYGQAPREYVIAWPAEIHQPLFQRDSQLFQEVVSVPSSSNDSLATRIFGNQLRRQKLSVKHLTNLLYERAMLYSRHVRDINSQHAEFFEQLSIERLLSPNGDGRHQLALESMLVDLDKEKRKEELDFWKDSKDIREVLFETGGEYQSASQIGRASCRERV